MVAAPVPGIGEAEVPLRARHHAEVAALAPLRIHEDARFLDFGGHCARHRGGTAHRW
jgi:hypothetical protein